MASTSGLLCLLLCCWYIVDETLGTNPGLEIRLSQSGLNYAATVAVQQLSAKVRGTSLPDKSGKAGKVEYEVKNIKVSVERGYSLKSHNHHHHHHHHQSSAM